MMNRPTRSTTDDMDAWLDSEPPTWASPTHTGWDPVNIAIWVGMVAFAVIAWGAVAWVFARMLG